MARFELLFWGMTYNFFLVFLWLVLWSFTANRCWAMLLEEPFSFFVEVQRGWTVSWAIVENSVGVNGIVFVSLTTDGSWIWCAPYRGWLRLKGSHVICSRRCFCDVWIVQYGGKKTTIFLILCRFVLSISSKRHLKALVFSERFFANHPVCYSRNAVKSVPRTTAHGG